MVDSVILTLMPSVSATAGSILTTLTDLTIVQECYGQTRGFK
jgi:hypothetical protein